MKYTVYDRLLRRELGGGGNQYSNIRGMYGDRQWIDDMDIINELDGHSGCVNALSWSRSGRLLASGSDDHHINIHTYQPDSSTSQFNLATTIMTGHTSNIFSVKFMPYSSDKTIVSATNDVRIFDIEHSGRSWANGSATAKPSNLTSRATRRHMGVHGFPDGVQVLTEGDTNAKLFRSHSDTVKRIVTEDSPFYFLTCSEDGDVRQWDIRQPSSHYPPPRDAMLPRWATESEGSDSVPAPLISYKRYHLDLNTVSCSPSQPHYIALGGAHLHCFLHDRRMIGRDLLEEKGAKLSSPSNWSDQEEELAGQATRCVRKFAPNGKQRMRPKDNGHITACKISDAHPNELIVSWSSDWIYSFDLLRSPDATEYVEPTKVIKGDTRRRVKDKSRKRKRSKPSASTAYSEGAERGVSRQRTEGSHTSGADVPEELALRVQYQNGQSEEIPIESSATSDGTASDPNEEDLSDSDHFRIAKTAVKLKVQIFSLGSRKYSSSSANDPTGRTIEFTSILGFAASILPEMDDIHRSWRYPIDPDEVDVALQNTLRKGRAASRRFVQASGTLARVLGGQLRSGNASAVISQYFTSIQHAPNERQIPRHEQFGYDFLKAILLWLDSGLGALVEGFSSASSNPRLPIKPDASVDAIDDELIPYLLVQASDYPIVNVDASRFETDDTRILFSTEKAAVIAFARALKTPFADLSGALVSANPSPEDTASRHTFQDRKEAIKHWAYKIGRGVLFNASKEVRFSSIDRSYGGLGRPDAAVRADEQVLRDQQEDIDPLEEDEAVVEAELVSRAWAAESIEEMLDSITPDESSQSSDNIPTLQPTSLEAEDAEEQGENDVDQEDGDSDGDLDSEDLSEDEDDDEDDGPDTLHFSRRARMLWRSDFDRSRLRNTVEADIPCSAHTRKYTGHCNVRTVKDVNYFGLDDEYVVSGSDSGHVFIWDRKTQQLLNILEGDGETVNVVQGHPYEPTMAVSGIDHTIKIFSSDAKAQRNARKGVGVSASDPSNFSSLFSLSRHRRRPRASTSEPAIPPAAEGNANSDDNDDDKVAPNGLSSRKRMHLEYKITSQNDNDRQGGQRDAFITRALLTQLAERMQEHTEGEDGDGEGGTIYLPNDDCTIM